MTDADAAWEAIERADATAWRGLPVPASYAAFRRRFPPLVEGHARVLLGSENVEATYQIHTGERYPHNLTASYVGDDLLLVEADLPRLAQPVPELLDALGQPAVRLDVVWGVLTVPGGLHVHAGRGLALATGPEGQVLGIKLFRACDSDTYLRTLHHPPTRMIERP